MMAAITRQIARHRLHEGVTGRTGAQHAGLSRVAARLAVQTVALLMVMLAVLEIVVYVIIQQRLLSSLEDTLKERASVPSYMVCAVAHLPCGPNDARGGPLRGGSGGFGSGGNGGPRPGPGGPGGPGDVNFYLTPSDASRVFITPALRVIHGDGTITNVILDRPAVRAALASRRPQCCSVQSYKSQSYLVYTAILQSSGQVVAVQTSISEYQFKDTMRSVLEALLVVALLGLLGASGITAVLVQRTLQPIRLAMQRQRDFVADAAHELRTPLAIQRAVAEVTMVEPTIEDLETTVEQMMGENQHLTRLVEDLSLLARADTDAVSIDRRPVDLSTLVADTARELAYLAEEGGHTLETDVTGGIRVTGDILRLRQLILILIDNALKHSPPGGTVTVRLSAPTGSRARLEVRDSGTGIDPGELEHIFDRFYRADKARTGEGTGLGLAIARWIVEAHGGHIEAGNVAPHGAVFTVTLPAVRAETQA